MGQTDGPDEQVSGTGPYGSDIPNDIAARTPGQQAWVEEQSREQDRETARQDEIDAAADAEQAKKTFSDLYGWIVGDDPMPDMEFQGGDAREDAEPDMTDEFSGDQDEGFGPMDGGGGDMYGDPSGVGGNVGDILGGRLPGDEKLPGDMEGRIDGIGRDALSGAIGREGAEDAQPGPGGTYDPGYGYDDSPGSAPRDDQGEGGDGGGEGHGDYIDQYLSEVFEDGDYDPSGLINEQRDASARAASELAGARGMAQSGALGGDISSIFRSAGRDSQQAAADYQTQRMDQMSKAAGLLFGDKWKEMDHAQQSAMAEMMLENQKELANAINAMENGNDGPIEAFFKDLFGFLDF